MFEWNDDIFYHNFEDFGRRRWNVWPDLAMLRKWLNSRSLLAILLYLFSLEIICEAQMPGKRIPRFSRQSWLFTEKLESSILWRPSLSSAPSIRSILRAITNRYSKIKGLFADFLGAWAFATSREAASELESWYKRANKHLEGESDRLQEIHGCGESHEVLTVRWNRPGFSAHAWGPRRKSTFQGWFHNFTGFFLVMCENGRSRCFLCQIPRLHKPN